MYQRAISTLGCGTLTLDEAATLARRHGLDGLELRALGGRLDLPGWFEEQFTVPATLASPTARDGLRVVALDSSFKLVGSAEEDRIDLLRFVPWAEALGVKHLRVFDGGRNRYDAVETAEALATLAWWRQLRAEHHWTVDLMVETHDSLLTSGQIVRLADAAGGVPLLWDAHHTWHTGAENPVETWEAIRRQVVHVHVKDSLAGHYVLPGDGQFPMAALRPRLAAEFSGVVSLEWERWWHPGLPPLEAALATAARRSWW
jgi:sugar phosphate isomerase/epimerase